MHTYNIKCKTCENVIGTVELQADKGQDYVLRMNICGTCQAALDAAAEAAARVAFGEGH